ncbi:DUF418 domain-containing protein [Dyella japonica]|uniref:DUF418 domain-containing protein n=1 Tax=Dyella japonica TaxID=231455 RepID=UPI00062DA347|nr:DUF418 domain-containing protein [Dyella japonica]
MSDHESIKEARPVRPERRLVVIDVLRGAALFGVLCVNLINEFRVSIFQQFLPAATDGSWLDHAVQAMVSIGMELKAFALFSLLFGVGLAIQFERLAATSRRLPLLTRRLLVLLGFGLIHLCFIWNGDILTEYALVGLLALPFLYASNRVLAMAAAVALAIYAALPFWLPDTFFWPSGVSLQQYVQTATAVYAGGTWTDVIRFNLAEIAHLIPLHVLVAPRTFALFLLGVMAWRSGLLRRPEHYRRLLIGMAAVGVGLGFGINWPEPPEPSSAWHSWTPVISVLITLGPAVLAIGYGAAIAVLYMFTSASRVLGVLGPLGRMAFSNYLAQSLIFGWIFFGYGLGRFGRMSPSHALCLGVADYVLQVIASQWWLKRYRFGPMEWLWRILMYGVRQPWRITNDGHRQGGTGPASELK